jgi:hypothetical protein
MPAGRVNGVPAGFANAAFAPSLHGSGSELGSTLAASPLELEQPEMETLATSSAAART